MTGRRFTDFGRRFTDFELREAREVDIAERIARSGFKLVRRAGLYEMCCPFHQERTPSFKVFADHWHCYGCGAHGDTIKWMMRAHNMSFPEAVEALLDGRAVTPAEIRQTEQRIRDRELEERAKKDRHLRAAWRLWEEARPIVPGDPVWRYLHGRGCVPLPDDAALPAELRLHPRLSHQDHLGAASPNQGRRPTRTWVGMVARVVGVRGQFLGVHRTYLVEAGEGRVIQDPDLKAKKSAKLTLGECRGGAIRLFPYESGELGLSTGIETSISAHILSGLPVWPCLDDGKMRAIKLPIEVEAVCLFCDRDKPQTQPGKVWAPEGVGVRSGRLLAARLRDEAHVPVRLLVPRAGDGVKDFNDEHQRRLVEARRMRAGSVEATVAP